MPAPPEIPPVIADWQREAMRPVARNERIPVVDVLRGFALLGILTVNILGFSWPMELMMSRPGFWDTPADVIADRVVQVLAEGKFYTLFAFLFGLGTALQMERAETRGAAFAGRFSRRLLVLFGFGLAHALLLWEGDILLWYAVCGFLLIPFRGRRPGTILIWAAICLLLPALLVVFAWVVVLGLALLPEFATAIQAGLTGDPDAFQQDFEATILTFSEGNYAEIFTARLGNLIYLWVVALFYVPTFFGMFLLGLFAGRRRIFQNIPAHAPFVRRVLIWGLLIGIPANLLYAACLNFTAGDDIRFWWLLAQAFVYVGGPALALAYAAGLTLLLQRNGWQTATRGMAAAGQMGLSNYLLQSLVCTTIFYGYGFGLYGSVDRAAGLGIVLLIYLGQVGFSWWWLQRFQFGPVEWLWRSLTYGTRQPLRRLRPKTVPDAGSPAEI